MIGLYRLLTRWWTAFALAASLAMLGAAHAFERFGGLAPCNLCLKQREVFWGAATIALIATLWALVSRASRGTPRIAAFLLAGFCVISGSLFHYKGITGTAGQEMMDMMNWLAFMKNITIAGGFLALLGAGAGAQSVDAKLGKA